MPETENEFHMCAVQVGVDLERIETEQGTQFSVGDDEGYKCPNEAVGRFEIETHAGPPMGFWLCEEHAEEERERGNIIAETTPDEWNREGADSGGD